MRGMRPHEELFWQMSGNEPVPKKQKLEPTPQECFLPVPQQGPFTDVPHPELYAVEPSVGRCAVVMQSPLVPRYLQDEYMDLVCLGSTIDPEPNPPPEQIRSNTDAISNRVSDTEDIVSVQFSSISSPFLDTSHVKYAARPATSARPPTSLSMASSTTGPDDPLDGVDQPFRDPISLPEKGTPADPADCYAHLAIGPPEHPDCLRTGRSANPPRDTVYPPGPAHCNSDIHHAPLGHASPRPPLEGPGTLKS